MPCCCTGNGCCSTAKARGITGSILLVLGAAIVALESTLINSALGYTLQLREGTAFWEEWTELGDVISVWVWNVTNSDKYTYTDDGRGGSWTFPVAEIESVGPFMYRQNYHKINISFTDYEGNEIEKDTDAESVRIRQAFDYDQMYDPNDPTTGLNPNTTLVNAPNLATLGIPSIIEYICAGYVRPGFTCDSHHSLLLGILRGMVNSLYNSARTLPILKDMPAQDYIWKYEDPLLTELHNLCMANEICAQSPIPDLLPEGIALLWMKEHPVNWNFYQYDTGKNDITYYSYVQKWSGRGYDELSDKLDAYLPEGTCNDVHGTDGHTTSPYVTPESDVWVFSQDLYRSYLMEFARPDVSPNYDLDAYRFKLPQSALAAPDKVPENHCLCTEFFWGNTDMECNSTSGGYIVEKPTFGLPLLINLPHFLYGDDWKSAGQIKGKFDQNADDFELYLNYHALSGLPMTADVRFQFSLAMTKNEHYDIFKGMHLQTQLMPMIWVNESFVAPVELEKVIWIAEKIVLVMYVVIGWFLAAVGLILIAVAAVQHYKERKLAPYKDLTNKT